MDFGFQVNMFYEAVGCIVSAEPNQPKRDEIIQELFRLPNSRWLEIIGLAMQDPSQLQNQETMRRHILTTSLLTLLLCLPLFHPDVVVQHPPVAARILCRT